MDKISEISLKSAEDVGKLISAKSAQKYKIWKGICVI